MEVRTTGERECNERSGRRCEEVKECRLKNFKQNTGTTQRPADVFSIFTRILIIVQVLASSQREPISRKTPGSAWDCSQLLAQHQALRGYVLVTVIYQYSSSTLLSSERAANCHICGDDNEHMHGLDINRFKAPLRQFRLKETTSAFVLLILCSDLWSLSDIF